MIILKYGNKILKLNGKLWKYEPDPFIPVPYGDGIDIQWKNTDTSDKFIYRLFKNGENVLTSLGGLGYWLYYDGERIDIPDPNPMPVPHTSSRPILTVDASNGYYDISNLEDYPDGIYKLDVRFYSKDGSYYPNASKVTSHAPAIVKGDIIDDKLVITGEWSEKDDKLTWVVTRPGCIYAEDLASRIQDYTINISGQELATSTSLEYSTSDLAEGDYTAVIHAKSKKGGTSADSNTITFTKSSTPVIGPVIRKLNRSLSFMIYDISSSSDFIFYADKDYSSVYYWSSYETNEKPSGSFAWGSTTYTLVKQGKLSGMTVTKISDEKYKYVVPKDNANCIAFSIPTSTGEWSQAQTGTLYMIDAEESPTYITENKLLYTVGDGQLVNWNNAVYTGNLVQDCGWMIPTENGTPYYEV